MNVAIINDSSDENNVSNHFIFIDRKWMSHLRLILGTGFDKLIEDKTLLKDVDNDIGLIIQNKNLKEMLKDRLNKLILHINKQEEKMGHKEKSFLKILNETEVFDINLEHKKPLAILKNTGISTNLENIFEKEKQKTSRFKKMKQKINSFINKEQRNKIKNKKAKAKLEGKAFELAEKDVKDLEGKLIKTPYGWNVQGIPFDLFFTTDGVNDKIRNKFLESEATSVNYSFAILDKKHHDKKLFKEDYFFYKDNLEDISDYINKENIDKLVEESVFLPEEIRKRYSSISSLLSCGMRIDYSSSYGALTRTGGVYRTFLDGRIIYSNYASYTFVRIFETKSKIQIESRTPMSIVEIIEEIKNERKKRDDEFNEKLKSIPENEIKIVIISFLSNEFN
uniref:Uncharacterized protein n=1 Tax=Meloidogyne hapla TaxID=6305 RepID=A0A1I8BAL7_MELHA